MRKTFCAIVGLAALIGLGSSADAQEEKFITIGTGGQTGVYFVVGQSICGLVNRGQAEHGIRCTAPSTGGSIANINAMRAGDMDMGVAQSDWQYHAYNGTSQFEEQGPFEELRAVFSVHGEPFNVIARADSGIETFTDLQGKRVNIGNPGSGQRATMEVVMDAMGWTMDDFALASELQPAEQAAALGDNNVDAIIYTVGHPNGSIQEATTTVDSRLIPVETDEIATLVEERPYYAWATVPGGMYTGTDEDIRTFGVKATFVAPASTDDEVVYQVVKAVFDNFDRFKSLHPAFADLQEEEMISDGLSAPLHKGAARYYRERGWIE
jgi:TRAP transporter TAXI family solute receptor